MFTGIIRQIGTVRGVRRGGEGLRLVLDVGALAGRLSHGDSLAVNGACLTVTGVRGREAEFDVVRESIGRTTLAELEAGRRVNLEPALRASDALDGHIVQGHVDGVAVCRNLDRDGQWTARFACDASLAGQMVPKGSIAIDGVSLTLADVGPEDFAVALIPTTLAETTLSQLRTGMRVNVELDLIGKYVRRFLEGTAGGTVPAERTGGLTLDGLRRAGFS